MNKRKEPLSYSIKRECELVCFIDKDGNHCSKQNATMGLANIVCDSIKGKRCEVGMGIPVSMNVINALKLKKGDLFCFDERWSTFKRLIHFREKNVELANELESKIHEERKEFEEWFSSNWDADYTIYFINENNYSYSVGYVESAWQTWNYWKNCVDKQH